MSPGWVHRLLRERKSSAYLGPQMQPPPWSQQLGTSGPLDGDSCQAVKNEVFQGKRT